MSPKAFSSPGGGVHSVLPGELAKTAAVVCAVAIVVCSSAFFLRPSSVATPYEILPPLAARCALLGFVAPVVGFAALDAACDESAWRWLGPLRADDPSTSERERKRRFLLRPLNAHSSNALVAAGAYIAARAAAEGARARLAGLWLGGALSALGLFSYGWWGSRRQRAWRADNRTMETIVVALAAYLLALAAPRLERALVGAAVAAAVARWPSEAPAWLDPLVVLAIACALAACALRGGSGRFGLFAAATCAALGGLVPKVADIKGAAAWGTAAFHLLEGFAFAAYHAWGQTLP